MFQNGWKSGDSTTTLSKLSQFPTLPNNFFVGSLPLHAHSFKQFIRILELDLLPPCDDIDESEYGVVEIVDSE